MRHLILILAFLMTFASHGGTLPAGCPRPSLAEVYEAQAQYWEARARHYAYGNARVTASRYRAAAEEAKALGLTQPLGRGRYPSIADQERVLAAMAEGASTHYRYGTSIDEAKRRRAQADAAAGLGLTRPLDGPVGPLFGRIAVSGRRGCGVTRQPRRPSRPRQPGEAPSPF